MADWGSCAVVGSGKPNRDYGAKIDKHNAVIRFNNAPTRKYTKLVGSKTTLRLQNRERCGYAESDQEICLHYSRVGASIIL